MCILKRGLLGSLLGFFSITSSKAQADPNPNPMNVLFIGNSYTHMNKMPEMFEQIAISKKMKIEVTMDAKSNHTFKMHSERPELYQSINSKKWDYVVLQGFSRELMYDYSQIDTASIPYFNKIVDSIYANNPCTNILLYMTWGYKEGSTLIPEADTYLHMSERIANGYKYLSNIYDFPIVPVGDVHKYVRENYPTINLYHEDNQHPMPVTSYLIASSFYTAIFKSEPTDAFIPKSVKPEEAKLMQESAYKVVNASIDTYKLRKNTLEVNYERTKTGAFYAYCKSHYANATSVTWDFGDGFTSNEKNVAHHYKAAGTYFIKLTVMDDCGTRKIYRKVYFKEPVPPSHTKPTQPTKGGGKKSL
ncbi:MAG: PKD domain-containing protein [Bacteroidota bacterium]